MALTTLHDRGMPLSRTHARPIAALLFAVVLLAATGCDAEISFSEGIDGSGTIETRTYDLDGFDSIDIGDRFDVVVTVGDSHRVEITADDNLFNDLDIKVRGDELSIHMEDGKSLDSGTLTALVELPELVALDVGGRSSADVTGVSASGQEYDVSGSSDVIVTGTVDDVDIDVSGSSRFTMEGTAETVTIDASGSSDVDLRLDNVDEADIDLSGSSDLTLQSSNSVTGDLSGASDLRVPADTAVDVSTSGGSDINRTN